jgi:hypothetical protein
LPALMASNVASTLAYSRILQTTQRSKSRCAEAFAFGETNTSYRVIIASIRNLGRCPCPRCLIPLDRAANMGMQRDMTQRKNLARIDDANRRDRVKAAREHIYEKSNGINSKGVENLLQETSLVPTTVYTSLLLGIAVANVWY